jgi:ABC-type transport system involved in multi-copper enzyme maturation permease subunit
MLRLLKIDYRKYVHNKAFWILLSIYLALLVIVFFSIEKVLNNIVTDASSNAPVPMPGFSIYEFPLVWQNLTFLAGFFKIFLALIVVVFITGEFTNRTVRQNIMNGMSRMDFLWSKVIFMFNLCLVSTLIIFLSGSILGMMTAESVSLSQYIDKIEFLPAYFLELFTFCSLGFLIAFGLRRSGLAIGLLAFYYYILEPAVSFMLPEAVAKYLPVEAMSNLIDIPNSALMNMFGINFREFVSVPDAITCLVYCFFFIGIVFLIYSKKDL